MLLQIRCGLKVMCAFKDSHAGDLVFSVAMFGSGLELFFGGDYWNSSPSLEVLPLEGILVALLVFGQFVRESCCKGNSYDPLPFSLASFLEM